MSALGVALAAVGCAPAGPQSPTQAVEPLRTRVAWRAAPGAADASISVLQAGDALGPQLILVHGTPGAASAWADYLLDPPAGLQVLALDRPGFGHSRHTGARPRLADQAAAVHALMARDGRPVLLLGHSLGGAIVAQVAADHPGQVNALVLLAASLDPGQETIHPLQRVGLWPGVRALLPSALHHANVELIGLQAELQRLATRLPDIRAKVVIVHGTRDELVPVANVAYMQSHLRHARCVQTVLLEGRNHFLPWNSQPAVRDAIRMALDPGC
jgi:pimeloyl-ACP methyl ester carboxylesterase